MDLPSERDIDGLQELADLLAEIKALHRRLQAPSAVNPDAIDAELDQLALRLRASEQKLKARKPVDAPGEG